jgi:hypothetical protein
MVEADFWKEFRTWAETEDGKASRAWVEKREAETMAEQLKVTADGEVVVLVAEGEAGTCEVRLKLDEVERFEEALDKARKRALRAVEARQSREAMRVKDVEDDEEE